MEPTKSSWIPAWFRKSPSGAPAPKRDKLADETDALCQKILAKTSRTAADYRADLRELSANWNKLKERITPTLTKKILDTVNKLDLIYKTVTSTRTSILVPLKNEVETKHTLFVDAPSPARDPMPELDALVKSFFSKTSFTEADRTEFTTALQRLWDAHPEIGSEFSHAIEKAAWAASQVLSSPSEQLQRLQQINFETIYAKVASAVPTDAEKAQYIDFLRTFSDSVNGRIGVILALRIVHTLERLNALNQVPAAQEFKTKLETKGKYTPLVVSPPPSPPQKPPAAPARSFSTPYTDIDTLVAALDRISPANFDNYKQSLISIWQKNKHSATDEFAIKVKTAAFQISLHPNVLDQDLKRIETEAQEFIIQDLPPLEEDATDETEGVAAPSMPRTVAATPPAVQLLKADDVNKIAVELQNYSTEILGIGFPPVTIDRMKILAGQLNDLLQQPDCFFIAGSNNLQTMCQLFLAASERMSPNDKQLLSLFSATEITSIRNYATDPTTNISADAKAKITEIVKYNSTLPWSQDIDLKTLRDNRRTLLSILKQIPSERLELLIKKLDQKETFAVMSRVDTTTSTSQGMLVALDAKGNLSKGAGNSACCFTAGRMIYRERHPELTPIGPNDAIIEGLGLQQDALDKRQLREKSGAEMTRNKAVPNPIDLDQATPQLDQFLTEVRDQRSTIFLERGQEITQFHGLLTQLDAQAASSSARFVGAIIAKNGVFYVVTIDKREEPSKITVQDSHGFSHARETGAPAAVIDRAFKCTPKDLTEAAEVLAVRTPYEPGADDPIIEHEHNQCDFHIFTVKDADTSVATTFKQENLMQLHTESKPFLLTNKELETFWEECLNLGDTGTALAEKYTVELTRRSSASPGEAEASLRALMELTDNYTSASRDELVELCTQLDARLNSNDYIPLMLLIPKDGRDPPVEDIKEAARDRLASSLRA